MDNLGRLKALKRTWDAARNVRDHSREEAAQEIGYALSSVEKVFAGKYEYPSNIKIAIKNYIGATDFSEAKRQIEEDQ